MQISKAVDELFSKHSIFRQKATRAEEIAIAVLLVIAALMLLYLIETS